MPRPAKWIYPINLPALAEVLHSRRIDIAPHLLEWRLCARDIANAMGEDGREVFHTIAAVWPSYDRRDSERCYNSALRTRDADNQLCPYIRRAVQKHRISLDTPQLRQGRPFLPKASRGKPAKEKSTLIDYDYFMRTQHQGRDILGKNNLTDLLLRLYNKLDVMRVLGEYCVGFDAFVTTGVSLPIIYWQINEDFNLINGKRMQYLWDGHRDKSRPPMLMYRDNPTCLYGLHLREQRPRVGIVESEKSCLVMALELTDITWMAVGGLNFLNEQMLAPIRDKEVLLYPDLDPENDKRTHTSRTHALWLARARQLSAKGFKIGVSDFLEQHGSTYDRLQKHDIADIFLNDRIRRFQRWHDSYQEC